MKNRDYREKDVMGFIGDMSKSLFPKPCKVTIMKVRMKICR